MALRKIPASVGLGLLFSLLIFEVAIRLFNLDLLYLRDTLFYSAEHFEVYQWDLETPHQHYKLKPGKYRKRLYDEQVQPPKLRPGFFNISINSHGFRSPERLKEKSKNVKRIFFFGGSNTYGIGVGDEETYSHQLQLLLDKKILANMKYGTEELRLQFYPKKLHMPGMPWKILIPILLSFKILLMLEGSLF